jgi:phasin
MLSLWAKSLWWAAWWPFGLWLFALEKATGRESEGTEQPSRAQAYDSVEQKERTMANDSFMKPEMPDAMRDLMKMSIEQAKRAFDTFVSTTEKTWKTLETTSQSTRASLQALNTKIADITRQNAEANFALAMKLAESKDINQALELQSDHARKQMETFAHQLEEMRDLAAKMIQESSATAAAAGKQAAADMASAASPSATPGFTSSSYAPTGESGRTY